MKGCYLTGFYLPQAGLDTSHHGLTSVSPPERPLMSMSTNDLTTDNIPGVPPPEDTSNDETKDPDA
jgi:hypothetical protein